MADKGAALNRRVWKLFSALGFETKPNFNSPAEHQVPLGRGKFRTLDLFAIDKTLGVTIIGWNKAREKLNESITTHLHDYLTLKEKTKAQAVLFVVSEMNVSEADKEYAEGVGVRIWTADELKYYETLLETIGQFAKYEVIHALGVKKTREERHTFHALALHIRQPFAESNDSLFLFTARPTFLLKTSVVLRKASGSKDAYQRVVQRKRLLQIRNFLGSEKALLPPNIIVSLSKNVTWSPIDLPDQDAGGQRFTLSRPDDYELVVLNIPTVYASLEVIDGQHRLFGFAHTDAATRNDFNLVVVGIADLDTKRRTETFISINDNARRMDPNLVFYLRYDPDEGVCQKDNQLMAIKIVVELNKLFPLRQKIRLLDVGEERITLKGFAGYDLKGLLGLRGALRKHYRHDSTEYVQVLRMYFSTLKELFPKQWSDPNNYIVFTNRGISAFLKLLKSILKTTQAPISHDVVKGYLMPIRKAWSDSKWRIDNLKSAYVGSAGWKNFHRDLVEMVRGEFPDFKE